MVSKKLLGHVIKRMFMIGYTEPQVKKLIGSLPKHLENFFESLWKSLEQKKRKEVYGMWTIKSSVKITHKGVYYLIDYAVDVEGNRYNEYEVKGIYYDMLGPVIKIKKEIGDELINELRPFYDNVIIDDIHHIITKEALC
jgi:hypothetical protein